MTPQSALEAEALAFDRRIEERVKAGFVPDLRRMVKCDYFYKSFWRDPHFVRLYLGAIVDRYLELIHQHAGDGASILDVGCGAGYVALELARAGHHVTGIDISGSCIDIARKTAESDPHLSGFGSLEYHTLPLDEAEGAYDVVLFSGCLHHFHHVEGAVRRAVDLVTTDGHLLCLEPCHEQWREADAAQVALIRSLLSLTGFWYESPEELNISGDPDDLLHHIHDIHDEYLLERDKHEVGQSPNDNASSGKQILHALRAHLSELVYQPMFSFLLRTLGGMRGPDDRVHRIADFLAAYDRLGVERGFLRPNSFIFMGRRTR
ncbi:MAG: methyltransferase domain-containing protein [Phycisphaerales bacterium]|nr:MAG: methyltransferase domain-containing protein [Phycisphaerales bacterium]